MFSILSNSVVFRKTMAKKQTNIIMVPDREQMHCISSMKLLATYEMYINCEPMKHPNKKTPKNTRSLNRHCWGDGFGELIPRIAYCLRSVWKTFIFGLKRFAYTASLKMITNNEDFAFIRKIKCYFPIIANFVENKTINQTINQ